MLRRNQCLFCSSRAQGFGSTNAGVCTTDIVYVHDLRLLLGEFSVVHTSVCGDAELDNAAGKKASRHASDGSARLYESEEAIHKEEENGTQEFASLRPSHMPNGKREVNQVQVMHAVEHIEEALPHQWDGGDPHHRTRQHRYHSRQVRNSIVFPFTQLPHATHERSNHNMIIASYSTTVLILPPCLSVLILPPGLKAKRDPGESPEIHQLQTFLKLLTDGL